MRAYDFQFILSLMCLFCFGFASSESMATLVFYDSFENPDLGSTGETPPTGWAKTGNSGIIVVADAGISVTTDWGDQVAWHNANGSLTTTASILSDVLTLNTNYTVSLNVGRRSFNDFTNHMYRVELLAGTNVIGMAEGTPASTNLADTPVTFIVPIGASHPQLGETLAIRFSGGTQPQYDNLSLEVTSVPEPTSIAMLGLVSLICVVFSSLRNRRPEEPCLARI